MKRLQQEITSLRSKKEETPNTKNLPIEKAKLELKRLQQKITSLRSKKEETSDIKHLFVKEKLLAKELSAKKLKLERYQTADLPLLKFKVATISTHSYTLTKPYQPWVFVGFGLAFGLFISISIVFLIDLKQLGAKETPTTST